MRSKKIRKIILHLFLLSLCLVFLMPFLWVVITSLKDRIEVLTDNSVFIKEFKFENYTDAWQAANFARQYINSIVVAILVTLGQVFTSALAGYALARMKFKGKKALFMTILSTMIVPYHILVVPLYVMLSAVSLVNTYAGLIVPLCANGFGIFLFRQFFIKVPVELEEAAAIDGASRWKTLWFIVFPQAMPAAVTLFIFTFVAEWNDLFRWLIFTHSTDMRNVQLGLSVFQEQFSINYVQLMAAVVIITIPTLVVFVFGQKKLIQGIAMGGLKD